MNEQDDWESLGAVWRSADLKAGFDTETMIRDLKRQTRRLWLVLAGEWLLALSGTAFVVRMLAMESLGPTQRAWWMFFLIVIAGLAFGTTWLRTRELREPAEGSLRDWLELRRRRALGGLRLAKFTRVVALLVAPALLVLMLVQGGALDDWRTWIGYGVPSLTLAGCWIWSRRQDARNCGELEEVEHLAREWLSA